MIRTKSWIVTALMLLVGGIGAFAQTQTCPRPDCPNPTQSCPRNGECPRRADCPRSGECPRNGGQSGPGQGNRAGNPNPAGSQAGRR